MTSLTVTTTRDVPTSLPNLKPHCDTPEIGGGLGPWDFWFVIWGEGKPENRKLYILRISDLNLEAPAGQVPGT